MGPVDVCENLGQDHGAQQSAYCRQCEQRVQALGRLLAVGDAADDEDQEFKPKGEDDEEDEDEEESPGKKRKKAPAKVRPCSWFMVLF